ncbi:MAG TPA: hypothetical protein VF399_02410 [bacterium]
MTNIEIRRKILEMTHERFQEHPYYRITPKEFKDALGIDIRQLHYNIIYLEEKGYLELQKPLEGSLFVGAKITVRGIDLVEDEYKFDTLFPVPKDTTSIQLNVFKDFEKLAEKVETLPELSDDLKELIVEELREIQKELKKIEPSYKKIKNFIDMLKNRNAEIYEDARVLLNHPVIAKILTESAKKELE